MKIDYLLQKKLGAAVTGTLENFLRELTDREGDKEEKSAE